MASGWRERCRSVPLLGLTNLTVEALSPADIIISKLTRADDGDVRDMAYLLAHHVTVAEVREALATAVVPEVFSEAFPAARKTLEVLLDRVS